MTALSGITAVRPASEQTKPRIVRYGANIAVGQPVYLDSATNRYKLCDSNDTDATAAIRGIAITPGGDGDYGFIAIAEDIILVGTTMVVGETYYLGTTPGSIVPSGDLASGHRVVRIGTASSATRLKLSMEWTGVTRA